MKRKSTEKFTLFSSHVISYSHHTPTAPVFSKFKPNEVAGFVACGPTELDLTFGNGTKLKVSMSATEAYKFLKLAEGELIKVTAEVQETKGKLK